MKSANIFSPQTPLQAVLLMFWNRPALTCKQRPRLARLAGTVKFVARRCKCSDSQLARYHFQCKSPGCDSQWQSHNPIFSHSLPPTTKKHEHTTCGPQESISPNKMAALRLSAGFTKITCFLFWVTYLKCGPQRNLVCLSFT